MKRKIIYIIFSVEALLCVALCFLSDALTGWFSSVMAFPFEQIAAGLRALSLLGGVGNLAAVVLYAALSAAPVGYMVFSSSRRKLAAEDALLALLSALLFAALYMLVNPARLSSIFSGDAAGEAAAKAMLGLVIWSVLLGYIVLRLLRLFKESNTEKLLGYMKTFLWILAAMFVAAAFWGCFGSLVAATKSLRASNTGNEGALGWSYVFLSLSFLVSALPWVLNVVTVSLAVSLLEAMNSEDYSQAAVDRAEKLSGWCVRALAAVVLSGVGYNVLQLIFSGALFSISTNVSIPITSICFVLAALIFARIVADNHRLKSDNDLFI